jgi:hypothetical protein
MTIARVPAADVIRQSRPLDPLSIEKRVYERQRATVPAIIEADGQRYSARLANVHRSGALLETRAALSAGTLATFQCGSIAAEALIAWSEQGRIGVTFVPPLSQQELQELFSRSRALAAWCG